MDRDTTLGAFIRNQRKRKGLTIGKAADMAQVSWRYWKAMEDGANVTIGILRKAAAVLDLTSIPIGAGVSINRTEATIDAGTLLGLVESIAARLEDSELVLDQLRDLALAAWIKADPLLETEAVKALFAAHPLLSEEQSERIARVAHRLSKDSRQPQPAIEATAAPAVEKKRRKA
jgi:transcriptional regulator with XRE-family HTH domain